MKRIKLLELGKKGTSFDVKIPAGTSVSDIEVGLAKFIIDGSKYRGISPATFLKEIEGWVRQLDANQ